MEYYPRKIEEKLDKWLNREEILLLKGPRQAGKTTLILHLKEKLDGEYITCEDEGVKKALEENPKELVKRYGKKFLFIDESQYVKDIGKRLKLIFDLTKQKLIVTGSGSFDIKAEVGKYLVGRAVYFELMPLNFEEFLLWKAKDLHKVFVDNKRQLMDFISGGNIPNKPVFENEFYNLLNEYIIFGGFPAIAKENDAEIKKELLKNLVRTYIEKDVFFFLGIRHIDKFRGLIAYLAFNNSSIVNLSSLMQELNMDYKTAENYLSVLSNTYVISLLSPFYRNLSTEIKKSKKAYFIDTGLRNSIINNFLPLENRNDKGMLYENFILNELKQEFDKINYWRTAGKAEVDFVISRENEVVPFEVKSETKLRRGFLSFINSYAPKRAVVFSKEFGTKKMGKTEALFVPHFFI